jgi:hypothetical protein
LARDKDGFGASHWAALKGYAGLAEKLLEAESKAGASAFVDAKEADSKKVYGLGELARNNGHWQESERLGGVERVAKESAAIDVEMGPLSIAGKTTAPKRRL